MFLTVHNNNSVFLSFILQNQSSLFLFVLLRALSLEDFVIEDSQTVDASLTSKWSQRYSPHFRNILQAIICNGRWFFPISIPLCLVSCRRFRFLSFFDLIFPMLLSPLPTPVFPSTSTERRYWNDSWCKEFVWLCYGTLTSSLAVYWADSSHSQNSSTSSLLCDFQLLANNRYCQLGCSDGNVFCFVSIVIWFFDPWISALVDISVRSEWDPLTFFRFTSFTSDKIYLWRFFLKSFLHFHSW